MGRETLGNLAHNFAVGQVIDVAEDEVAQLWVAVNFERQSSAATLSHDGYGIVDVACIILQTDTVILPAIQRLKCP